MRIFFSKYQKKKKILFSFSKNNGPTNFTGSLQYRWVKRHSYPAAATNSGGALPDKEQLPGNKRRRIRRLESAAKADDGW